MVQVVDCIQDCVFFFILEKIPVVLVKLDRDPVNKGTFGTSAPMLLETLGSSAHSFFVTF